MKMLKNTKKLLSALLVLLMVVSTALPAFAAPSAVTAVDSAVEESGKAALSAEAYLDLNFDGIITIDDAILLFNHTMIPEAYGVPYSSLDYTWNGKLDIQDAILLFLHTMFPNKYPIASAGSGGVKTTKVEGEANIVFGKAALDADTDEVRVPVMFNTSETFNSIAVKNISYDDSNLELIGFEDKIHTTDSETPLESLMFYTYDKENRAIVLGMQDSIGGYEGKLCDMVFRVKDASVGATYEITAESVVRNNSNEYTSNVTSGTVTVKQSSVGGDTEEVSTALVVDVNMDSFKEFYQHQSIPVLDTNAIPNPIWLEMANAPTLNNDGSGNYITISTSNGIPAFKLRCNIWDTTKKLSANGTLTMMWDMRSDSIVDAPYNFVRVTHNNQDAYTESAITATTNENFIGDGAWHTYQYSVEATDDFWVGSFNVYVNAQEVDVKNIKLYYRGDAVTGDDVPPVEQPPEENVYYIYTASDLYNVRNDLAGTYYLMNDIDLSEYANWEPIGIDVENPFTGIFDGQGYEISGIHIDTTSNFQGLFGCVYNGTVKNVGVTDSYIKGGFCVGGVVGVNSNGTVSNCYNTGEVSGSNQCVGGVVGIVDAFEGTATVQNCYNTGTVSGGYKNVGGVVGLNDDYYCTVENCYNAGNVSGNDNCVGGVVGENRGTITNCYNAGTVSGGYNNVGGVVGYNASGTVSNCYNKGEVSGSNYVGGVVGDNNEGTVENCYNAGTASGSNYVGGVVGYNYNDTVENCYNAGTVSGGNYVGGVVGYNYNGTVENCYNIGTVTGEPGVGGVVGYNTGTVMTCYNTGTVSGSYYVGGVVGYNGRNGTIIEFCYYLAGCATDESGVVQNGIGASSIGSTTADVSGQTAGLTDTQMKQQSSFAGFDFEAVWGIDGKTNSGYPYLLNMPVADNGGDTPETPISDLIFTGDDIKANWDSRNFEWEADSNVGLVTERTSYSNMYDPIIQKTDFNFNADSYKYAIIEMMVETESEDNYLQLFFAAPGEGLSEEKSMRLPYSVPADGGFGTFVIDLSQNELWTGTIGTLRLDPFNDAAGSFEIKQIRFTDKYEAEPPVVDGDLIFTGDDIKANWNHGGFEWEADSNVGVVTLTDTSLMADPIIMKNDFVFSAEDYKYVIVDMVVETYNADNFLQFFFAAPGGTPSQEKSVMVTHSGLAEDGVQTLVLDLTENELWTGDIGFVRFDPFNGGSGSFEIKQIRFTDKYETEPVVPKTYNIYTASDLYNVRNDLAGTYYLMNDIDLSLYDWEPIGNDSTPFTGTFNGNNHTITGLYIHKNEFYEGTEPVRYNFGLFGTVLGGTIRDLSVDGEISVSIDSNAQINVIIGGLAGVHLAGTIDNCYANVYIYGDVFANNGYAYIAAGGLLGVHSASSTAPATLKNSSATGTIELSGYSETIFTDCTAGGLVGENYSDITDCYAMVDVSCMVDTNASANANAGGLIGGAINGTVADSYATGTINASATSQTDKAYGYGGGLVGAAPYGNAKFVDCYAEGNVTTWVCSMADNAQSFGGGFIGQADNVTFENCHATGAADAKAESQQELAEDISSGTPALPECYAGGFVGNLAGENAVVKNCYAAGSVYGDTFSLSGASRSLVGGFAGIIWQGAVYDSYATGEIDVSANTIDDYAGVLCGGFVGQLGGENATIERCFATGYVDSSVYSTNDQAISHTGGFVGHFGGDISDCYAMGGVNSSTQSDYGTASSNVGGFVGSIYGTTSVINNSYSAGYVDVYAQSDNGAIGDRRGGFAGVLWDEGAVVANCYYDNYIGGVDEISDSYATGLTTEQMMYAANFKGFDFDNVWAMDEETNDGYPYLLRTELGGGSASPYVRYTIEYYFMQEDGTYTVNRVEGNERAGETVAVGIIDFDGYEYVSHADEILKDVVRADGSTVLRLYYNKVEVAPTVYTIYFYTNDGTLVAELVKNKEEFISAEEIPFIEVADKTFLGWATAWNSSMVEFTVEALTQSTVSELLGDTLTIELYPVYVTNVEVEAPFAIEYYFMQADGTYRVNREVAYAIAGERVSVATDDFDGYEYVSHPNEILTATVRADGSTVLRVYYKFVEIIPEIIPVTSVTLNKTSATLTEGDTLTLTATVAPDNATNKSVTWSSDNKDVATVVNGTVTAVGAGTATITVATEDGAKSARCTVTVKAKTIPVTSITLNKTTATLTEGDTLTLTATVAPDNATNKSVTWSSDNKDVATVVNGTVTAVGAGTATITVTTEDGAKSARCTVTVKAKTIPVTSVTLNKTSATLTEGDTLTLTATVAPDNATNKSVTWSSDNKDVATVVNGTVTAVGAGTATITVTTEDGAKSARCTVTVKAKTIPVTSITLNKTTATLTEGDTLTLTATVAPDNATNKSVTWSSDNKDVATVVNGTVTAVGAGTATITVATEDGAKSASCVVTVNAKPEEPPVEADAVFTLGKVAGRPGDTVKVPLVLDNDKTINSIAIKSILYDTENLEFVGFEANETFVADALFKSFDTEHMAIAIGWLTSGEYSGEMCSFVFKIKDTAAEGEFAVSAQSTVKNSSEIITSRVDDGAVTVTFRKTGDITGDDSLDINDAILLFQHSMMPEIYQVDYVASMDFNKDGVLDINDAILLFQHSMMPEIYPLG